MTPPFRGIDGVFLLGINSGLQKLYKALVAGEAAAVFQWTSSVAGDQSWMEPDRGREAAPEQHVVDPVVAVVVVARHSPNPSQGGEDDHGPSSELYVERC